MEALAVTGCPNLISVNITNSQLSFATVSGILATTPAGKLVYQDQGTKNFPVNAVDVVSLAGAGTTIASSSETPVSSADGVYVFDNAIAGQPITCVLENSNYPGITLSYTISLLPLNAVNITTNAVHGSISVSPSIAEIGDDVTITVTADALYDLVSFLVDDVDKTSELDANNQYTLRLENAAYVLTANFTGFGGSGEGVSENPYIITTEKQLSQVRNDLAAYYELGNDIALTAEWTPIKNFTGTLDGKGHVISGLWTNIEGDVAGLFGSVSGNATITNLGVVIDQEQKLRGQPTVGGIVGEISAGADNTVTISNSFVNGDVIGSTHAGGIVGRISNGGTPIITNCYAIGSVLGVDGVGGIVGKVFGGTAIISNCYAANTVAASSYSSGGIVGSPENNNRLTISNCVAINQRILTAGGNDRAGRINGYDGTGLTREDNFAFDGMLVKGELITDGTETNKNGLDKSLPEIRRQSTYETDLNWDFDGVWSMGNGEYPLPVLKNVAGQPTSCPEYLTLPQVTIETSVVGDGGSISAHTNVFQGDDVTIVLTPDNGYVVDVLTVNDEDKTDDVVDNEYLLENVSEDYVITVQFRSTGTGTQLVNDTEWLVYPNPTYGEVFLQKEDSSSMVSLYDYTGRLLLQTKESVIDLTNLAQGVYFLQSEGKTSKVILRK